MTGTSSTISETHIEIRRDNPGNDFYLPPEKTSIISQRPLKPYSKDP
jgi:hypothetical protein